MVRGVGWRLSFSTLTPALSHREGSSMRWDTDKQPLNPLDLGLRCIDLSIRGVGYPGFETQLLVWLGGRVSAAKLRRAIERLGRRRPVVTARLIEPAAPAIPYWQFQPDRIARLAEIELPAADDEAVLKCAGSLLSTAFDPAATDPLRFYLLRRPGGGDVFLMQFNHVLMDNTATTWLLRELDQLAQDSAEQADDSPHYEPRFVVSRRLRQVPHAQRRAGALAAIELQAHALRGRAALLASEQGIRPRRSDLQVTTREVAADQARSIRARIVRSCGLPTLSMAILASAFRAIRALGPQNHNADRRYMAGIGMDLRTSPGVQQTDGQSPLLQNLLSVVAINAMPDKLADRDELVRYLNAQMRDRLEKKIDLGVLRVTRVFQRRPRHMQWVADHMLRWSLSLWYAYFGSLDSLGPRFCGAEIERAQYIGPTWSPMGIALLVNQFRGRLCLQLTHDPDLVPPLLAQAYLDWITSDLL